MLHLNIWIQKVHQNISYWQKRSFRLPSNLFHNKLLSVLKVLHLNAFDCWHNVFSKNIKTQSLNKFSMNLCIKHFTCIKPTNKQKIPLSKWHHPPSTNPSFSIPNCGCVVNRAFFVPCVVSRPIPLQHRQAWRGFFWLWLAWGWHSKGGERKRGRDANHLISGEQGLRERARYTERCLCFCQSHFFFESEWNTAIG